MFKLVSKNIKARGVKFLLAIVTTVLLGGLFIIKFYSWEVFMMYGYMAISYLSSEYIMIEKKQSTELLALSLPVTRAQLIGSKYITSLIAVIIGITVWYLGAFFWDNIIHNDLTLIEKILYPKVFFMAMIFLFVHQSLFIALSVKLKQVGTIIAFVISTILGIWLIATWFAPYKRSYNPEFTIQDIDLIIGFTLLVLSLLSISIHYSLRTYKKLDL